MKEKLVKKNQSVERSFSIIEAMCDEGKEMKLQDIAVKTKLPAGTVLRQLYTLMTLGYVAQNENNQMYFLTLKLSYVGRSIESKFDTRRIVKPHLEKISKITGEATCLSIKDNNEILYIDSVDGRDSLLKVTQKIGKKAPLHCTAAGKIYLAQNNSQEMLDFCDKSELVRFTEHTITNKDELIKSINVIRENGYAIDDEECELGVRCVAVPLRKYDYEIVATVSVTGPISRMTTPKIEKIKYLLLQESKELEQLFAMEQ